MIINKQALSSALKMVAPVISSNPVIPALAGVKITEKHLIGGNSWVSVAVPLSLGIGEALLEYQTLSKAVYALAGDTDIAMKDGVAVLKNKSGKVQVPVIGEMSEYPGIKQEFKHEAFELTREDVVAVAGLSEFTDTPDSARPLKGLMYDGSYFYASDGHTMATYHKESGFEGEAVFPKDLFKLLANIPATDYKFRDGIVEAVSNGEVVAFVKYLLLEDKFPAIRQLLNGMVFSKKTTIQHDDLAEALNLLSISTNDATKTVEFHFEGADGVMGKSYNTDLNKLSEVEISAENEGFEGKFAIGFNHQLLTKGLRFLGGETYTVEMSEASRPTKITSETEGRLFIIMPIFIQA